MLYTVFHPQDIATTDSTARVIGILAPVTVTSHPLVSQQGATPTTLPARPTMPHRASRSVVRPPLPRPAPKETPA